MKQLCKKEICLVYGNGACLCSVGEVFNKGDFGLIYNSLEICGAYCCMTADGQIFPGFVYTFVPAPYNGAQSANCVDYLAPKQRQMGITGRSLDIRGVAEASGSSGLR